MPKKPTTPRLETKATKYVFTDKERLQIGTDLGHAYAARNTTEDEFDQVKAAFKERLASHDARIGLLSNHMTAGFEMRNEVCWVSYDAKAGKKTFYRENDIEGETPLLVEDMKPADYQADLIQAESGFERKEEIPVFLSTDQDRGVLVVGRYKDRWYSALRITIAGRTIEERLDSEQKSVKNRYDAVKLGIGRAKTWMQANLGMDAAKGFEDFMDNTMKNHKEREE